LLPLAGEAASVRELVWLRRGGSVFPYLRFLHSPATRQESSAGTAAGDSVWQFLAAALSASLPALPDCVRLVHADGRTLARHQRLPFLCLRRHHASVDVAQSRSLHLLQH